MREAARQYTQKNEERFIQVKIFISINLLFILFQKSLQKF